MFDLYKANQKDTARFILGRAGTSPLFVVGLNPSTANREKSDVTATKVARVAEREGYKGFVMTNLYPLRSTDPHQLPARVDNRLLRRNLEHITELAKEQTAPHFWAAWGAEITKRKYLSKACQELAVEVANVGGTWWCFGPQASGLLTRAGHPRHPSRLSYAWALQPFDIQYYLSHLANK